MLSQYPDMHIHRVSSILLLAGVYPAEAAWINICDETRLLERRTPAVSVEAKPQPGCRLLPLPLDAEQVSWANAAPPQLASTPTLTAFSAAQAEGLQDVELLEILAAAATPAPIPPLGTDVNLLPSAAVRAFGVEERAHPHQDPQGWHLSCEAGVRAAGALLSWPAYRTGRAHALRLNYSASTNIEITDATGSDSPAADPRPLGALTANQHTLQVLLPPPHALSPLRLSLVCPPNAATLTLESITLTATARPAPISRAAWAWSAHWWQTAALQPLLARLNAYDVDRVYVAVPPGLASLPSTTQQQFADYITALKRQGLHVWAVIGDPSFVLPAGRGAALQLVDAMGAVALTLEGIQLDIEPYLLPGYENAPALARQSWNESVLALAARAQIQGWPTSVVVPFWWTPTQNDPLDAVSRAISELVVMDYRTNIEQIMAFAEPFLDWGAAHDVPVRIALENGPIATEPRILFRPAKEGDLWLVQDREQAWAVKLKTPAAPPAGKGIRAYRGTPVPGADSARTTFANQPAQLQRAIHILERQLSPWTSYRGLAVHGLEPLPPMAP